MILSLLIVDNEFLKPAFEIFLQRQMKALKKNVKESRQKKWENVGERSSRTAENRRNYTNFSLLFTEYFVSVQFYCQGRQPSRVIAVRQIKSLQHLEWAARHTLSKHYRDNRPNPLSEIPGLFSCFLCIFATELACAKIILRAREKVLVKHAQKGKAYTVMTRFSSLLPINAPILMSAEFTQMQ